MSSEPSKDRLPFEPQQKKKKPPKTKPVTTQKETKSVKSARKAKSTAIPEAVSKRMIRRMALFSGIPTALGISSFVASYVIVSYEWFKLPNYAVVLVSMGCFGLGVIGLSYGILSTSWDEDRAGGWWGAKEFNVNLRRMVNALRSVDEPTSSPD